MKSQKLLLFAFVLIFATAAILILKSRPFSVFPLPFGPDHTSSKTSSSGNPDASSRPSLTLNGHQINLEIADNHTERQQGLSNHPPLTDNEGMLFVFDRPGDYGFWMKDMLFPLDFIYLNGNIVVDLIENVPAPQPGETPATVRAKSSFDKVLEVNAGLIAKIGVKVGDKASILL